MKRHTLLSLITSAVALMMAVSCSKSPSTVQTTSATTATMFPTATLFPTSKPFPLPGVSRPQEGKFLFVELWIKTELVSGTVPYKYIDIPTYDLDQATRSLNLCYTKSKTWTLSLLDWGFVGSGQSMDRKVGSGAASWLYPVSRLPYTHTLRIFTGSFEDSYMERTRPAPVKLLTITSDGTLSAEIDGERVMLNPNDAWSHAVQGDFAKDGYEGRYLFTYSVTNFGWLDRDKIQNCN